MKLPRLSFSSALFLAAKSSHWKAAESDSDRGVAHGGSRHARTDARLHWPQSRPAEKAASTLGSQGAIKIRQAWPPASAAVATAGKLQPAPCLAGPSFQASNPLFSPESELSGRTASR